jgi:hypothetical protein
MPLPFARDIVGHDVQTVRNMGWLGTRNGELLRRAAAAGFDAIVTMDRNMAFQQNLSGIELGILVVRAPSNRLEALQPLAGEIGIALDRIERGQVVEVGGLPQQARRSNSEKRPG